MQCTPAGIAALRLQHDCIARITVHVDVLKRAGLALAALQARHWSGLQLSAPCGVILCRLHVSVWLYLDIQEKT